MTIALPGIRPDDYDVIRDGGIVGHIYHINADRKLVPAGRPGRGRGRCTLEGHAGEVLG